MSKTRGAKRTTSGTQKLKNANTSTSMNDLEGQIKDLKTRLKVETSKYFANDEYYVRDKNLEYDIDRVVNQKVAGKLEIFEKMNRAMQMQMDTMMAMCHEEIQKGFNYS